MASSELNVVTGAFGYTGKYIARRLLRRGKCVLTLTSHLERAGTADLPIRVAPFSFDDPPALIASLQGTTTLYNTYWVRFCHRRTTFERAIRNTRTLISAAAEAGVRRFVHLSITNPSEESPLPYFRGKALLERALTRSGMSYAIIRPTVVFGTEDILINNIAWLLREFPVFCVPGSGEYRLQPVYVEDLADLAVAAGQSKDNTIVDAVGPEVFTFEKMVRLIRENVRSTARLIHVAPPAALFLSRLIGWAVRDVVLTPDELEGLMAGLLVSSEPPTGSTGLSEWLDHNAARVGTDYASELGRHYR